MTAPADCAHAVCLVHDGHLVCSDCHERMPIPPTRAAAIRACRDAIKEAKSK